MEQLRGSQDGLCFREFRESYLKVRDGLNNSGCDERTWLGWRGKEIWSWVKWGSLRAYEEMNCARPCALENSKYVQRNEAFEQLNTQQFWAKATRQQMVCCLTQHTGTITRIVVRVYNVGANVILFTLTLRAMQSPSSSSLELGNSKLHFMQSC